MKGFQRIARRTLRHRPDRTNGTNGTTGTNRTNSRLSVHGIALLVALPMLFSATQGPGIRTASGERSRRAPRLLFADKREAAPQIRLIQQNAALSEEEARTGATFAVETEILRNGIDAPMEVALTLHQRVQSRAAFDATTRGTSLRSVLGTAKPIPVGNDAVSTAIASVRVSAAEPAVGLSQNACAECVALPGEGVYPVQVELRVPGGDGIYDEFTTHLVVTGTDDRRLAVAVVVPLRLAPGMTDAGEPVEPDTAGVIGRVEALARRPIPPVTLLPTPESIETLARQANDPRPELRSPVLDLLRTALAGREILSSPYRQPSTALLDDQRVEAVLRGSNQLGRAVIESQLAAPVTDVGVYDTVVPMDRALRALNTSRLIVSPEALEKPPADASQRGLQAVDVGALDQSAVEARPTIVADTQLTARLRTRRDGHPVGFDARLGGQLLLSELAVIALTRPTTGGVAIVLDDQALPGAVDLLLDGLGSVERLIEPVTATTLFDRLDSQLRESGQVPETLVPKSRTSASVSEPLLTESLQTQRRLTGFQAVFSIDPEQARPAPVPGASDPINVTARALRLLYSAFEKERSVDRRTESLRALSSVINTAIAKVRLAPLRRITLTGRQQEVPLAIINDTGYPANVVLEVESDNVILIDGVRDPGSRGRLSIRESLGLQSRIERRSIEVRTRGPGSFSMFIRLRGPDGLLLSSTRTTVRSTAVSGLGTVLTGGALGFLALWWMRSIRRRRRAKALLRHPSDVRRKAENQ